MGKERGEGRGERGCARVCAWCLFSRCSFASSFIDEASGATPALALCYFASLFLCFFISLLVCFLICLVASYLLLCFSFYMCSLLCLRVRLCARARGRACSTPCRASPGADQVLEIHPTVGGISTTLLPTKASYDRRGS